MSTQFEIMMCNGLKIGFPGGVGGNAKMEHEVPSMSPAPAVTNVTHP